MACTKCLRSILSLRKRKLATLTILAILLIYLAALNLIWLSAIICSLLLSFQLLRLGVDLIKTAWLKFIIQAFLKVVFLMAFLVTLKLFVFSIFRIPSISMNDTLFENDIILVNKLVYGPKFKIPNSYKSFIRIFFKGYFYNSDSNKKEQYFRASGTRTIRINDVLVFHLSETYFIVKRCVGLPGNQLEIRDGEPVLNSRKSMNASTIVKPYNFIISNKILYFRIVDSLKQAGNNFEYDADKSIITGLFNVATIDRLKGRNVQIKSIIDRKQFRESSWIFAHGRSIPWTIDNMGPFTIPQKGFKIELDPKNYAIYEKVINENEGNKIQLLNNKVLINGKVADQYTFKKNYYFVMGDNRQLALDSRFLGFIPEDHIEGKVQCVIYSNDFFLNFGRMLKQIK